MEMSNVWKYLKNYWVLAGLVIVVFSSLLNLLPVEKLDNPAIERLIDKGIDYLFFLGLVSIVLGFIISHYKKLTPHKPDRNQTAATLTQSISGTKGTAANIGGNLNINQPHALQSDHQQAAHSASINQQISDSEGIALNIGGDVNIRTNVYQSADYQELKQTVEKARRNVKEYPNDAVFTDELQQAEEKLEAFVDGIRKLLADIDKIPLNSERGIKAKQYFEEGKYQSARDILDAEEMGQEQQALLHRQKKLTQQQEDITSHLNDLAGEFILKARLTAVDYQLGEQRIPQTRRYFEQALESGRMPEGLFYYALFLQENNQFIEAEKLYEEALKTYRQLAQNNPAVYLPDVAMTLNNLGNLVQADSSRREEAEKLYQEALKIYRQLAQNNPAVYLPDVATTLNNLGILVKADSSRREEAEKLYQEALKTYRQLAQNNPAVYLPDVATTLNNLGLLVSDDSSRREEAEKLYQEALTIRRQLAQNNPAVYLPDVATTLNNLGILVKADSSRREEAEKLYQEALTIRRQLAQNNPAVYLPDVANTLAAYGFAHLSWQQTKKAIIYLKEAEEIFTIFAAQAPQVFKGKLDLTQQLLRQASETEQN